ncbi:hypothetical protein B5X24_HaOG206457 [Helicoverpa armigera]|uniref:Uncharacterized protein n=1 Tax=Helicoverpa armigera TaxID=29058 RepID=A0A2W1BKA3_HELAM|nr:hypothetical protein B5X24_HaOG206457 [Helicoverpa armigera]
MYLHLVFLFTLIIIILQSMPVTEVLCGYAGRNGFDLKSEDVHELSDELENFKKNYALIDEDFAKKLKKNHGVLDDDTHRELIIHLPGLKKMWGYQAKSKENLEYFKEVLGSIRHPENKKQYQELRAKVEELSLKAKPRKHARRTYVIFLNDS